MLPIGVVIPTRNSAGCLPQHVAAMRDWVEQVEEVVVVDSFSEDGTVDYLKSHLRHPRLRFLSHPPGLYESWNFGLEHLGAKYAYIATAGESITADGLRHLLEVAERFSTDVVISRPSFYTSGGRPIREKRWPIHDLLEWKCIRQPVLVEPMHVFLLSVLEAPECVLGSSASNLYLTHALQRFPFPADYGHLGDNAWSIQNAFKTSLAVTPKIFSRFVIHPSGAMMDGDRKEALVDRLFDLAQQTLSEAGLSGWAIPQIDELSSSLRELPAKRHEFLKCQHRYERVRDAFWPWIFNPLAWQARTRRNHQRNVLRQTNNALRRHYGLQPRVPSSDHMGRGPGDSAQT